MHDGYGVGLVFDLINDIISTIVLFGSTILKNIHTYLSDIDYNIIGFDMPTKFNFKLGVPSLLVITIIVSPVSSVNVIPLWRCAGVDDCV